MQPIPPAVFYNTPSTPTTSQAGGIEERLGPALFSNSTNAPHPPAVAPSLVTSVTAPPSTPDESSNNRLDTSSKGLGSQPISSRKAREAFSLHDLDQLLRAVIEVNPYMAPQVARRVQESGCCLNRESDTLKNQVESLLTWVEGGEKKTPRSALGKEWERDPALFASLSGKLDAMQHLKLEAKGTKEEQKEREKQVQNAAKDVEARKMREEDRQMREADRKMREADREMREAQLEEERKARQALLEETRRANDQQERTSTALLDILRQGLLN
ncbi:hypothetical protein JB92DRAFT_3041943 [Gautieria morchelliformis]|nr:hypothetical protein JB92DRAFT_3041943 [Gautieria morchelliformis]